MPEKLQLPYAEIYTIQFTPSKKSKNLDSYVKEQLGILHPGFCSDSLWDYKKLKGSKNVIKAVVLDRAYFIECRIKKATRYFYIVENNIRYKFFTRNHYTNIGRRKTNISFYILLILVPVLVITMLLVMFKPEKTEKEVDTVFYEEVPEISCAYSFFDVLNFAAGKVYEGNGLINTINYVFDGNGKISLLVNGIEPYDLVNQLIANENIENCRCTNISYTGSTENYEIQIDLRAQQLSVDQKSNLELLELQKQLTGFLHENNTQILNSAINQDFCKVNTELIIARNETGNFHKSLKKYLADNNLFITSFLEQVDQNNKCLIQFEVLQLSSEQKIENALEDEYISKVLPEIKISRNAALEKQKTKKKKTETVPPRKLTKIGSAIQDGKKLFYYRTEEGKLLTSEEEL
ncbi:MAG: hypothetical protein ACI4LS_06925 [Treponema sp.]